MSVGYVRDRRNLQTLLMSAASKKSNCTSHKEKYLEMELVILLARGSITFSDTIESIRDKVKGEFSESDIVKCLDNLMLDLKAEEHQYKLNLRMLYDR